MDGPTGDPFVGSRIAHYQILAKLGEGGMGVVYRARDTRLNREVALKLLPPEAVDDPGARARLLREARTASRLNHPHICTIHEVGQVGDLVYVTMEFVEGRPLTALIPAGGMAEESVVRYGAQIARALAHAHEHGVVHRDLKTANVVVGAGGQTKLLDFGLSRQILDAAGPSGPGASAPSTTGAIVGTPQYIAPEVLMGAAADARSDIWALGVVLYEMGTGRPPFGAGGVPGVVTAILHSTPAPLPDRLSGGLRSVVMRCLAKDPEQRYQRAGEVAAGLEALSPEAVSGGVGRRGGRGPRWMRRRWRLAAVAALLLAFAAGAWWRGCGPGSGADATASGTILILPLEVRGQIQGAAFAGRAFAEALAVNLAQRKGVRVMPVPSSAELPGAATIGPARAAFLSGASRLIVGALTRDGDSLRASVSLIDTQANQVLWGEQRAGSGGDLSMLAASLALGIADRLGAQPARRYDYVLYVSGPPEMANSPEMAEALGAVRRYELPQSLEATQRLVERFPREPEAHLLRAVALWIDLVAAGPDSARSQAMASELVVLHRLDRRNPWNEVGRAVLLPRGPQAMRLLDQVLARNDLTPAARGAVLAMRSDAFAAASDTARALADAEQAVRLDPASDLSLSTLARHLAEAGRYEEAAARVRQALALNPTVVNYWLQLGNCMLKQGRWEDYVTDLERAAALSPSADAILSAQSNGLSCVGRYREAADCARRAARLEPGRWEYGFQLGLSLMRLGQWQEASALLERGCREGHRAVCPLRAAALAVTLLRAGDEARAQEQARRAEAMTASGAAPAVPESKSGDYALACYHALRGDRDEAIRLLERLPARGWVEPALDRDPNLISLRRDPRFRRVVAWMRAQPIDRVFRDWGRSL